MFPLYSCDFVFPTHVIVYWEHTRRGQLERFDWESNIFPRSAILPVVKVSSSTILIASGLQRGLDVVITVRKSVKYLEDQNRRYDQDKMPPLLCRVLILRKNFLRICIEQWGTKKFPRGGPKSYPLANFQYSTLTGLLVPIALSRRKWLSYWKWPNFGYFQMQKDNNSSSQLSFILGKNCRYVFIIKNTVCRIRS